MAFRFFKLLLPVKLRGSASNENMQVFIANKSTFKKGWSRFSLFPEAAEGEIPFHIIEQAIWLNEELNCELSQEFQSDSLQCEDE